MPEGSAACQTADAFGEDGRTKSMTTSDDAKTDAGTEQDKSALPIAQAIGAKRLIAAIIIMPFIAVAATVAIIVYAKSRPRPAAELAETSAPAALRLPPGGRIVETQADGKRLIVRVETPSGGAIIIFDIASGAEIQRIAIVSP